MDMSKLMNMLKEKQSGGYPQKERTIKPQNGVRNRYRILPGWNPEDRETFFQEYGQHFIKGIDGKIKAVYTCQSKTFGHVCPVCSTIERAIPMTHDDATLRILEEAQSSSRILLNVIEPDSDDPTKVKILEVAPSIMWGSSTGRGQPKVGGIAQLFEDWNLLDMKEGADILITRTGEGKLTKYSVGVAAKSKPVPESILERLHDLKAYAEAETKESETRAITAVQSTVGLIEAPSSGSSPALGSPTKRADSAIDLGALEKAVNEAEAEEVAFVETEVAEVAATPRKKAVAPAAAAASSSSGDDELESMLAGL